MDLQLVTLTGIKRNEAVYGVTLPTVEGEIAVFPHHEPLITILKDGVLTVRRHKDDVDEMLEYYAVTGGVAEIGPKKIKILVDEADHSEEIVEADAKAAYERALRLQKEATDQIELEKAHQLVDRHAVRLKVAGLRRHKHRG